MSEENAIGMGVREVHDGKEVERLKSLLRIVEGNTGERFSMIQVGDYDHLIILTTSSDVATDYERTMLACFARAALDQRAAYHAGRRDGVLEAFVAEHGEGSVADAPEAIRTLFRMAGAEAINAAQAAANLTRIAMAPFGLVGTADGDVVVWTKPAVKL